MNTGMLAFLSLLPIIAVAIFLVGLRWPASKAMPISYLVAIGLALFVWEVPGVNVAACFVARVIYSRDTIVHHFWGNFTIKHASGEWRNQNDSSRFH